MVEKNQTKSLYTRYIRCVKTTILQHNWSYQRFSAWALVLIFTAMWSLKTVHVLLSHHHDSAKHPVCEASHDQNRAHIHDERWATEDCGLCAFVVAASEPFSLPCLPDLIAKIPEKAAPVFYQSPRIVNKGCDVAMRRGPPQGRAC